MQLDERLSLAASLYEPSMVGADIGTDHAYLPAYLLTRGICSRMLLCDVSEKALGHARTTVARFGLEDRTKLILGDGLPLSEEAPGCISVTGMGGETMSGILTRGADRLRGAVLVLSAHTELPVVRRTIQEIGYHITAERICEAAGRMYLVWRAEPGAVSMTEEQLRYGDLLYREPDALLGQYLRRQLQVIRIKLDGIRSGSVIDEAALAAFLKDEAYYTARLAERGMKP